MIKGREGVGGVASIADHDTTHVKEALGNNVLRGSRCFATAALDRVDVVGRPELASAVESDCKRSFDK